MIAKNSAKHKPTRLVDIAEKAAVSRVAVAKVILGTGGDRVRVSEETRQRILAVAGELGYRPNRAARMLVGGRSGMIGVLIDSRAPMLAYEYLGHLDSLAAEKEYRLLIGGEHDSLGGIVEHMHDFAAYGAEGVIVLSHDYPDFRKEINQLLKVVPNIVCIGDPGYPGATFVEVDLRSGIRQMVEYFYQKGHRRIGMVLSDTDRWVCRARHSGYREGLEVCGLPLEEELVVIDPAVASMVNCDIAGMVSRLVTEGKATAIVAQNDLVAAGLIRGLHQVGLSVPGDVAVSGVDNVPMGKFFIPSLTTIRQPPDKVAEAAFKLLMELVAGKKPKMRQITVAPELIFRESA